MQRILADLVSAHVFFCEEKVMKGEGVSMSSQNLVNINVRGLAGDL